MADAALHCIKLDFSQMAIKRVNNLQHKISVNGIVEQLYENNQQSEPSKQSTERGHNPGDLVREPGPSKPEQPSSKENPADDNRRQTPSGDRNTAVRLAPSFQLYRPLNMMIHTAAMSNPTTIPNNGSPPTPGVMP